MMHVSSMSESKIAFERMCKSLEVYVQDYSTLDPSLQQAFVAYLEQRGINTEFGEFLMAAHEGKEHKEYMSWLSRVQSFLGRK